MRPNDVAGLCRNSLLTANLNKIESITSANTQRKDIKEGNSYQCQV